MITSVGDKFKTKCGDYMKSMSVVVIDVDSKKRELKTLNEDKKKVHSNTSSRSGMVSSYTARATNTNELDLVLDKIIDVRVELRSLQIKAKELKEIADELERE